MITLASDCLLFQMANGERVPFSAEMITVEISGDTAKWLDQEFVTHAAKAVFHYFRAELGRQTVTVAEFAEAMEKVLGGFAETPDVPKDQSVPSVLESDLSRLAREFGQGCELIFFPRLRRELRQQLQHAPKVVRFRGLRGCVKQLVGAQRWSGRCQGLEEQIVHFLRECLSAEAKKADFAMVVE